MILGVNYAGTRFGWDFGPPPVAISGSRSANLGWATTMPPGGRFELHAVLESFKSLGLRIVRFPIFGDGWNYGSPVGIWKGKGWDFRFDPPPLSSRAVDEFELMLRIFESVGGIQVMPVLTSYQFFGAGTLFINCLEQPLTATTRPSRGQGVQDWFEENYVLPGKPLRPPQQRLDPEHTIDHRRFMKGGKGDVAADKGKRQRFLETVLEPLFNIAANHRRAVFAVDILNEPELAIGLVDQKTLQDYLSVVAKTLQRYGLPSTVGFQHYRSIKSWDIAVSLPQFHYYPEDREKPELPEFPGACLGEMATSDVDAGRNPWPPWPGSAQGVRQGLADRLRVVQSLRYGYALLWSAAAPDPYTRWDAETRAQLKAFTSVYPP